VVGLKTVDDARLAHALSIGAHAAFAFDPTADPDDQANHLIADNGPVDAVVEATGSSSGTDLALRATRALGTVVTVASSPGTYPVEWRLLHHKELRIAGQISHPHVVPNALDTAVRLQRVNGIDLGGWVTHTFGLDQVEHAIRVASYQTDERPIKVVLNPQYSSS
jgi:threonine dehydrogenase-like Zn-dependent dehydrogenase